MKFLQNLLKVIKSPHIINDIKVFKKRVSKYCVEGERGFIKNHRADGNQYLRNLESVLEEMGWL